MEPLRKPRWFMRLHWQIAIAMALAVPFGLLFGEAGAGAVGWLGDLFLRLLKMVVVPLVALAILSGVTGVGNFKGVGRLGLVTVIYYLLTSLAAIGVGLLLANWLHPGDSSLLGLAGRPAGLVEDPPSLQQLLWRLVPENPIEDMVYSDDDPSRGPNILGVIFFALVFGLGALALPAARRERLSGAFDTLFEAMMKLTGWIIRLAPLGVFALLARVIGQTGLEAFAALGLYLVTVLAGLTIHAGLTLPLVCWLLARRNPWRYARAVAPALATAFSAASSNAALPVTLEQVEREAGISNRVCGFVLPLGATVNMDGTALYECVAVLFISQCYGIELGLGQQLLVMLTALLASVGAAGIPHAGLVMMGVVLGAVGLPLEGVGLILAVDRILDMCRTAVNVFGDTVGAAVVERFQRDPVGG